jgi:cyanophycin synthetase
MRANPFVLLRQWSELNRRLRRYRLRAPGRSGIDLNALERTILEHLFTQKAAELGLSVERFGTILRFADAGGRRFHVSGVWTDFDTMPVAFLSGDKVLVRGVLGKAGLCIPEGASFSRGAWRDGLAYAASLQSGFVVKPARGTSSGRGVSVLSAGASGFRGAFDLAALYSDDVLIERFAPGENYRFLVYKGNTLSVLLRDLPSVAGDGVHDISALMAEENKRRITRSQWLPGDPVLMPLPAARQAVPALRTQGLTPQSVPAAGTVIRVALTCNYASGTSYLEMLPHVNSVLLRAAERAALEIGVTLAGVDVIAPDIQGTGYVINEVNTTPGLESHYFVRNEESRRDPIREILADVFALSPAAGSEATPAPVRTGKRESVRW